MTIIPQINANEGAGPDVPSYLKALTAAERAYISAFASPPPFDSPLELPARVQDPAAHLRLLDQYDRIASRFIPDAALCRPTLAHHDAHGGNIFLSREALAMGEVKISSVLDWQHTTVIPLYLQAQVPEFIQSLPVPPGEDVDKVSREHDELSALYHALYYRTRRDLHWAAALDVDGSEPMTLKLPRDAALCWGIGYVSLQASLIEIMRNWANAIGGGDEPCPLHFSDDEIAQNDIDQATVTQVAMARAELAIAIGALPDNSIAPERYHDAVKVDAERREDWLASLPTKAFEGRDPVDHWPYRGY